MARLHGRSGRLYAGIASAGTAEPITFLNSWSFDASTDDVDVTAFGDTNKTYVSGLPDFKGFVRWILRLVKRTIMDSSRRRSSPEVLPLPKHR